MMRDQMRRLKAAADIHFLSNMLSYIELLQSIEVDLIVSH